MVYRICPYAIAEIGGHQVWVSKGRHLITNRVKRVKNPKESFFLNRIVFAKVGDKGYCGTPYLRNISIIGKIKEHIRGSKITVYKMKSKKKYRLKKGHRQEMTKIEITWASKTWPNKIVRDALKRSTKMEYGIFNRKNWKPWPNINDVEQYEIKKNIA